MKGKESALTELAVADDETLRGQVTDLEGERLRDPQTGRGEESK
jgi:hypothetical protein